MNDETIGKGKGIRFIVYPTKATLPTLTLCVGDDEVARRRQTGAIFIDGHRVQFILGTGTKTCQLERTRCILQ